MQQQVQSQQLNLSKGSSAVVSNLQAKIFQMPDTQLQTYLKQGSPDRALTHAEQMTNQLPRSAAGFIRKAEIYLMYGYKKKALTAYDDGLKSVTNSFDIQQLLIAREKTMMEIYNAKCIDFMAYLPMEIVNQIISRLSKASKAECLSVSKTWRARSIASPDAWRYLSIDSNIVNIQLASVLRHVAPHVRYFTVKNVPDSVHRKYLENIPSGYFKRIESLEIAGMVS